MVSLTGLAVPSDAPAGLVESLRRFVRAFPLDFGTVDVVADDAGGHYIIDVNTTAAYNYPIDGVVEYMRGGLTTI
jgi:D-alanine-D-alanine ligase-like ATP-grasp enzyme